MKLEEVHELAGRWRRQRDYWTKASDPSVSTTAEALIILDNRITELEALIKEIYPQFNSLLQMVAVIPENWPTIDTAVMRDLVDKIKAIANQEDKR